MLRDEEQQNTAANQSSTKKLLLCMASVTTACRLPLPLSHQPFPQVCAAGRVGGVRRRHLVCFKRGSPYGVSWRMAWRRGDYHPHFSSTHYQLRREPRAAGNGGDVWGWMWWFVLRADFWGDVSEFWRQEMVGSRGGSGGGVRALAIFE